MNKIVLNGKEFWLGGGNPIKYISKKEYGNLTEEEKKKDIVYIVDDIEPVAPSEIEEYDTIVDGYGWHVRKWSNGYCELDVLINLTIKTTDWKSSDILPGTDSINLKTKLSSLPKLPISLSCRYSETSLIDHLTGSASYIVSSRIDSPSTICNYLFFRPALQVDHKMDFRVHITGRWN